MILRKELYFIFHLFFPGQGRNFGILDDCGMTLYCPLISKQKSVYVTK